MTKKKQRSGKRENAGTSGTLLQTFKEYVKEHPAVDDIIAFLSEANASWLVKLDSRGPSDDECRELTEFYWYFMANYGERTERARYANWGREPLVLRMAECVIDAELEEKLFRDAQTYLANLPENGKVMREANALCSLIFAIRKDRELSSAGDENVLILPGTIPREDLEHVRTLLLYRCAVTVREQGAMVVQVSTGKKRYDLFGFRGMPDMRWEPIPADVFARSCCTAADGTATPPFKGVRYIAVDRAAGYTGKETAARLPKFYGKRGETGRNGDPPGNADIIPFSAGKKNTETS